MTAIAEREFQAQVEQYATLTRWRWFHAPDNRPGKNGHIQNIRPGFPDWFGVRGERIVAIELKAEKGTVKPAQVEWLAALEAAGVETYVFRPSQFEEIMRVLK